MARWKVIASHYIHAEYYGQATEWAREETNRETGRTFRKTMKVPMLIDPNDPTCINRFTGMCVVATQGSEQPGDIVMFGPPTPDLEPLDAEAEALSAAERPKWKQPLDELPLTMGEEFASGLLRMLESKISAVQQQQQQPVSLAGASNDQLAELKALVLAQQEQINKLVSGEPKLAAGVDQVAAEPVELEDIDPDAPPAPPPQVVTVPKPPATLRR